MNIINNTYEKQQEFIEKNKDRLNAAFDKMEEANGISNRFEQDGIHDMAKRFSDVADDILATCSRAVLLDDISLLESVHC